MIETKVLTIDEINEGLQSLPGWTFANDKISKEFQFKDFMDSLNFVNKLAPLFEENDHHPDVHIMYSKVKFDLQRFDVGGKVTLRDLFIAGELEKAFASR